ncbi:hypothetical protein CH373_06395 [Leptospira perolatii]|uniref:DUF1697 domain-containing protein n=1 Tax=Leptospira perolatii TaxID=2023191 RepID=A0A2M9ZNY9_9LEPT|nr:DUF1697 domain-containing protein [Leptospira perolatii]PJZ70890.1 hypothetical protein CH360_05125 [Leptospira perolatii]PJZ73786.1 hypothetical protein CH373_06395 [Leptospira perolatii]
MTTFIALLRGINVSGQKIIKMDHLKSLFEALPFQNVRTYIQSGNVIFQTESSASEKIREQIEKHLEKNLGFQVKTILRTRKELESAVKRIPFQENEYSKENKLYISFLSQKPNAGLVEKLISFNNEIDEFRPSGKEIYIVCKKGYGKSVFSNQFLEKKLDLISTTRNLDTVQKILEISKNESPD